MINPLLNLLALAPAPTDATAPDEKASEPAAASPEPAATPPSADAYSKSERSIPKANASVKAERFAPSHPAKRKKTKSEPDIAQQSLGLFAFGALVAAGARHVYKMVSEKVQKERNEKWLEAEKQLFDQFSQAYRGTSTAEPADRVVRDLEGHLKKSGFTENDIHQLMRYGELRHEAADRLRNAAAKQGVLLSVETIRGWGLSLSDLLKSSGGPKLRFRGQTRELSLAESYRLRRPGYVSYLFALARQESRAPDAAATTVSPSETTVGAFDELTSKVKYMTRDEAVHAALDTWRYRTRQDVWELIAHLNGSNRLNDRSIRGYKLDFLLASEGEGAQINVEMLRGLQHWMLSSSSGQGFPLWAWRRLTTVEEEAQPVLVGRLRDTGQEEPLARQYLIPQEAIQATREQWGRLESGLQAFIKSGDGRLVDLNLILEDDGKGRVIKSFLEGKIGTDEFLKELAASAAKLGFRVARGGNTIASPDDLAALKPFLQRAEQFNRALAAYRKDSNAANLIALASVMGPELVKNGEEPRTGIWRALRNMPEAKKGGYYWVQHFGKYRGLLLGDPAEPHPLGSRGVQLEQDIADALRFMDIHLALVKAQRQKGSDQNGFLTYQALLEAIQKFLAEEGQEGPTVEDMQKALLFPSLHGGYWRNIQSLLNKFGQAFERRQGDLLALLPLYPESDRPHLQALLQRDQGATGLVMNGFAKPAISVYSKAYAAELNRLARENPEQWLKMLGRLIDLNDTGSSYGPEGTKKEILEALSGGHKAFWDYLNEFVPHAYTKPDDAVRLVWPVLPDDVSDRLQAWAHCELLAEAAQANPPDVEKLLQAWVKALTYQVPEADRPAATEDAQRQILAAWNEHSQLGQIPVQIQFDSFAAPPIPVSPAMQTAMQARAALAGTALPIGRVLGGLPPTLAISVRALPRR